MTIPPPPRNRNARLLIALALTSMGAGSAIDPLRLCKHGVHEDECLTCALIRQAERQPKPQRSGSIVFAAGQLGYATTALPCRQSPSKEPTPEQIAAEEKRRRKAEKLERAAAKGAIKRST